jgi:hypothetical protein
MLLKLGDHVADCHIRAAECEAQAREATNDGIKAEFLKMAKRWSHLARSYEFVETVERFLLDAHKKVGSPFHLENLLENLPKPPPEVG